MAEWKMSPQVSKRSAASAYAKSNKSGTYKLRKKRYRKNAAHANIFVKGQLFLQKYSCVVLHQKLPLNSASVYI